MFNYLKQKNKRNEACPAKLQRSRGFTLVEVLVAISIFSMSIIALMSALANGISDTNHAKNKIIASYLAEEGIEYIRNMRDTYVLYDTDPATGWVHFLTKMALCESESGCKFNDSLPSFNIIALENMSVPECMGSCSLYYNSVSGKYSYINSVGSIDSGFAREIYVNLKNLNEVKVTSIIYWSKNSIPYNISFSDNLLQWRE